MKLSNKILIGFFSFLFLYLSAVFAEIRFRGSQNIMTEENSAVETVAVPEISHLVLRDIHHDINVSVSDHPRLEVRSFTGNLLKNLTYKISGDTLILSHLEEEGIKAIKISLFLPHSSFRSLTVDNSIAILDGISLERLSVRQYRSRVWSYVNDINTIVLDAQESYFDISGPGIDTLSAAMDQSELNISAPLGLLKGTMQNSSHARLSTTDEIQFRKDRSSRLVIF